MVTTVVALLASRLAFKDVVNPHCCVFQLLSVNRMRIDCRDLDRRCGNLEMCADGEHSTFGVGSRVWC